MKFNIQSKLLQSRLMALSKVVNSKNTISILDNFLFALDGNTLTITASDQETTLTTHMEVQDAEGKGKFAINVKWILDSLKQLPDLGLSFDINDETLEVLITYMSGKYNFIAINGDEFPQKAQDEGDIQKFVLAEKNIVAGIQHTIFAVGTEDIRRMMMGIDWDIYPDKIVYVATDTHKLVKYTQNIGTGLTSSFILPTKPASILGNILDRNSDENVEIAFDTKSATFTSKDYTMSCRFINGKYPNYDSVIPMDHPYTLSVDRQSLLAALRRVSVFASVGGLVRLELWANEINVSSQDLDFSTSAEDKISCEYDGEGMTIGFNGPAIIDVLNNIDTDTVLIKLLDPTRAGLFLPSEQKEGEELVILLMTMMI